MKCQTLFSGENNKIIISLSADEFAQNVVMVNIRSSVW